MMDGYSRFPEVPESMKGIFAKLGIPEQIVSDNGSNFRSDEMKTISGNVALGIEKLSHTPLNPAD